jgi:hypothetical protein
MQPPAADQIWLDVGAHEGEKTLAAARGNPLSTCTLSSPTWPQPRARWVLVANHVVVPVAVAEENGSASST